MIASLFFIIKSKENAVTIDRVTQDPGFSRGVRAPDVAGTQDRSYFNEINIVIDPIFNQLRFVDQCHLSMVCRTFYQAHDLYVIRPLAESMRKIRDKLEMFGIPYCPSPEFHSERGYFLQIKKRLLSISLLLPEEHRAHVSCSNLVGEPKEMEQFLNRAYNFSLRQALGTHAKAPLSATLEESASVINRWVTSSEAQGITSLNLAGRRLSVFPKQICQLKNLQDLFLSDNAISTVPFDIGNLTLLRRLSLVANRLIGLPPQIGNLSQLKELYLGFNTISVLPSQIGRMHRLRVLFINNNNLAFLPRTIGRLFNLRDLDISKNRLTSLPQEISNLRLHTFDTMENPIVSLLPRIGNWYVQPFPGVVLPVIWVVPAVVMFPFQPPQQP
jgi:hypothetical protein